MDVDGFYALHVHPSFFIIGGTRSLTSDKTITRRTGIVRQHAKRVQGITWLGQHPGLKNIKFKAAALVERIRDEKDRRYFEIILTPAGSKLIKKIYPAHLMQIEQVLSRITEKEQAELVRLCGKLEGVEEVS